MLRKKLTDAGLRVDYPPPEELRGVGQDIVRVLMRIESDIEGPALWAGGALIARRVVQAFKDRHPGADVEVEELDEK